MAQFVRESKYRHVFGQQGKKEYGYDNVKVTDSAWDTNVISASTVRRPRLPHAHSLPMLESSATFL
ncbi:DUF1899-domain-containing protein [Polyporus arcularius HHB13444]|uniref:DUF1899-domain-containing protein n=1 Tax=Polyporus arcularius HHB13444 TaxID=1314778 RepID=A0A5C3NKB8_9APHY|nr:DUF1899-domain-containing protein [Polyporus arcularius HHB13444]